MTIMQHTVACIAQQTCTHDQALVACAPTGKSIVGTTIIQQGTVIRTAQQTWPGLFACIELQLYSGRTAANLTSILTHVA